MSGKSNKVLYYADLAPISQNDIENALRQAGLQEGDIVMVHSDVGTFGKLGEVSGRDEFLNAIRDAFINVLGEDGTLIVPTYTYSFCKGEVFDVHNSKPSTGIFSDHVRRQKDAVRSEDPIFSHAGIGKAAGLLLKNTGNDCFGEDSFFDRFYKSGGKIVNFGKFFDITFLHYIEKKFGVKYRYPKKFSGALIGENGKSRFCEVHYYVRALPEDGFDVDYDMTLLGSELERRGLLKKVPLGNDFVLCSKVRDCFDTGLAMLRRNAYAFLKHSPEILEFPNFPFHIGVFDTPDNKGLPTRLPLLVEFNDESSLIVSRYSEKNEQLIQNAYVLGSIASTNLGEGSFGIRRAEDVLKYLLPICRKPMDQISFLEVGCADGYLLHRLKLLGAKEVAGCEPGPLGVAGRKKFGLSIVNDFFKPGLFDKKFDVIFSYGVLEHIRKPQEWIQCLKGDLSEEGIIFSGVPNCEQKLRLGDIQILGHEHWNYFTSQSLKNLLTRCGLTEVEAAIGRNEAMVYAWGKMPPPKKDPGAQPACQSDRELFGKFCRRGQKVLSLLQQKVQKLETQGKTLGLYGGGYAVLGVLNPKLEPRFFNTDISCHGQYYAGFQNPIEDPKNLLQEKVDELWIMAIDYDDEILHFLTEELKLPEETQIFSYKKFLESLASE